MQNSTARVKKSYHKAIEDKRFYCATHNRAFGEKRSYLIHLNSKSHNPDKRGKGRPAGSKNKIQHNKTNRKYKCIPCISNLMNLSNYNKHLKSKKHARHTE